MRSPIRILLVARARLFRQCLAAALRRRRFEVVGDAATGPDAASKARVVRPDVVVLDPEVADAGAPLVAGLHEELLDADPRQIWSGQPSAANSICDRAQSHHGDRFLLRRHLRP